MLAVADALNRAPSTCCRAASGSKIASVNWLKMFTAGNLDRAGRQAPAPPPK